MNVLPIPMEEPIPISDELIREQNVCSTTLSTAAHERPPNSDGGTNPNFR